MTEAEARTIERLRAGAGTYACGGYLAALDGLQRTEICTALIFDRLQRKMRTVETLHGEADGNWNQTFYLLYFRTLGDRQNQEAFLRLARKVPYKIVLRERLAPHAVEAMLLGASGLLELYRGDAYTLDLRRSFEYLAAKYGIEATDASEWALTEIRPANHPVLRLAQAAEFFAQDEFIMERARRTSGGFSASKRPPTGARTTSPAPRATKVPSASGRSRPTSSESTSSPSCNSPTEATPAANVCATAP